jgi:hypothetical protein
MHMLKATGRTTVVAQIPSTMSMYHLFLMLLIAASSNGVARAQYLDCAALGELQTCFLSGDNFTVPTGQHICRERWNIAWNGVIQQRLCIPPYTGQTDDKCGCCGGNCPVPCGELCPLSGEGDNREIGVYVYDWWAWVPRRRCETKGESLRLKEQNPSRWRCIVPEGFFRTLFSFRSDDDKRAVLNLFN